MLCWGSMRWKDMRAGRLTSARRWEDMGIASGAENSRLMGGRTRFRRITATIRSTAGLVDLTRKSGRGQRVLSKAADRWSTRSVALMERKGLLAIPPARV